MKTAVVYGANASGKSNLYRAFRCMWEYVLSSINYGGRAFQGDIKARLIPYLLDSASKEKDSSFEVWYYESKDKKIYNYGFSVGQNGISEEWLNVKSKTNPEYKQIFYRNGNKPITFGDDTSQDTTAPKRGRNAIPKTDREYLSRALNNETLILSLGARVKIQILERVSHWFENLVFLDFGNPGENLFLSSKMPRNFADDKSVQNSVVGYLSTFDKAIKGFDVQKLEEKELEDSKNPRYHIWSTHTANNGKDIIQFPLMMESAGTRKMFAIYEPLLQVLSNGGVLVIDELNDRLHPLLVRNLIQTFFDAERNPNNAQLIFTTHDVIQLATDLFRRDEIWFVEKDGDGASQLYSLADFQMDTNNSSTLKNLNNAEKDSLWYQYLLGKYGAIPELEKIFLVGENHDA